MKLKIIKCNKFVDTDKGIVVTKINDNMGNQFEAKAICQPEDIFDEKIGRKLSYLKAKKKMYARYERAYKQEIAKLNKMTEKLVSIKDDLHGAVNKLECEIKDIIE